MSVIHEDACLRHHFWQQQEPDPGEMRTCRHCGGIGKMPRDSGSLTSLWAAVFGFVGLGLLLCAVVSRLWVLVCA